MNYLQFVNTILETSKSHKLVYEVGEGDIYEHLNSGDHKYPCVFLTVQNVDSNGSQMTVTGSLFYVDVLLSDTSNKLQIQSTGMTTLQQIFMRLMDNYPDFDLRTGRYTPFDEKFADLCAGVFSNFSVSFMDDICIVNDDIFEGDIPTPPTPPTPPEPKYLTITVDKSNSGETVIEPKIIGSLPNLNLQYRINNGEWNDFIVGTTADIHVVAGDFVQWKGNNQDVFSIDDSNYIKFDISGNPVHLSGNIMSLIDGIGETKVIPCDFCFSKLFQKSNIKTVSKDFLPATTLASYCYYSMFYYCNSLVQAPELPATVLASNCYHDMFSGCYSLTQSPELPATLLASNCYKYMFAYSGLTQAPELPATTLANSCYNQMFHGCYSLTQAPELPATTLAESCYFCMFWDCGNLVQAPELPVTTLADSCYRNMFEGCNKLVQAPELPATTLAESCYEEMFKGCTSLTKAPELNATTLYDRCYLEMFQGCTALVNAPVLPATTLANNCYMRIFSGCSNLNYVKCLATYITATDALTDWLLNVAPTGTFVKPAGVSYETGSSGIPQDWTVEEI